MAWHEGGVWSEWQYSQPWSRDKVWHGNCRKSWRSPEDTWRQSPSKEELHWGRRGRDWEDDAWSRRVAPRDSWWESSTSGGGSAWDESSAWATDGHDWVREATGQHQCTLIWLHSCHGRPEHVEGVLEDLEASRIVGEHLRVVAPSAPLRPNIEYPPSTLQWFEYTTDELQHGRGPQDNAQHQQLREQRALLVRLLDDELRRLPRDGRLVLGGLSQGASMALDLLLHSRSPHMGKLQGVVARRGMLQAESVADLEDSGSSVRWGGQARLSKCAGVPVLATHGSDDDLVPISAARRSYDALSSALGDGVSFRFRVFKGLMHTGYSAGESDAIAEFVRQAVHGQ